MLTLLELTSEALDHILVGVGVMEDLGPIQAKQLAQLKQMGAQQVRSMIQSGRLPVTHLAVASAWLKELDRDEEAHNAAASALLTDVATRSAEAAERQADAAESANARATIALIIAIISIIVSAASMWISHLDALKHS